MAVTHSTLPEASERVFMPQASPKVSIITLTLNTYEVTRDCLLTLRKLDYPNFEVILVDNGSTDSSQKQLEQDFPEVRHLRNATNLGFAAGNNVGVRDALVRKPDYVLLLNNDTLVAPNFLSEMIRVVEEKPAIGMANPKILYHEPSDRIWYAGGSYKRGWSFAKHFGINRRDNGKYNQVCEVSFATGCALLVRADLVRKVGLLDELFFLGCEDLDWCVRAQNAGFKAIYVPSAVVWHRAGYDTKKNLGKPVKDFYYARNSLLHARKHLEARHWPFYALYMARFLAYRTAGYLVRMEPKRVAAMYRGLWSGWATKIDKESRVGHLSEGGGGLAPKRGPE
jgi:GT2 family glycosyltransferase